MKKLILLILFLVTQSAWAYLPQGCYQSNGSCWNLPFSTSDCDGLSSAYYVGTYMAGACQYVKDLQSSVSNYTDAYKKASADRDYNYNGWSNCTNSLNVATDLAYKSNDYALTLETVTKLQTNLIKKLRKACGTKCSKIR